ncbi:MAG: DUF3616 domain-containing protein [Sedimentisphaerales bacterium]|nr:DUF3616 domain-containing protein [Sedimentisphaerales bacterium]
MKTVLLYCSLFLMAGVAESSNHADLVFYGTSDTSAGVALNENMFVAADDENNIIRVYKTDSTTGPICSYDLTMLLDVDPNYPEADIEGATIIGNRIYFITSHGRNKDGKMRPGRYQFFALSFKIENQTVIFSPVGTVCKTLVNELVDSVKISGMDLERTVQFDAKLDKKQQLKLAPKKKGFNIEALCASSDGKTIYIGMRNPRLSINGNPDRYALVIPLVNPDKIIEKGQKPLFGEPLLWNLGGLGIRGMEYSDFHKAYFIIAGPHNENSEFVLYKWSGIKESQPVLVRKIEAGNNFTPEALVPFKNSGKLLLLSDDGSLIVPVSDASECMEDEMLDDKSCLNKHLTVPEKKTFRAMWLQP